MGVVGVKMDTAHWSVGSSDSEIGLNRWSCNALLLASPYQRETEGRGETYLIKVYSLRPSARGIGVKVPIHPLNLGLDWGRDGSIVFHVTNIALVTLANFLTC